MSRAADPSQAEWSWSVPPAVAASSISMAAASNSAEQLETGHSNPNPALLGRVRQLVTQLYLPAGRLENATANAVSEELTAFQKSLVAPRVAVQLLFVCAPGRPDFSASLQRLRAAPAPLEPPIAKLVETAGSLIDEQDELLGADPLARGVLAFFAAQTVARLCQAGGGSFNIFGPDDVPPFRSLRQLLAELLYLYRFDDCAAVQGQLAHACSICALFELLPVAQSDALLAEDPFSPRGSGFNPAALNVLCTLITQLSWESSLYPSMLEVLSGLVADIHSPRLALTKDQRARILRVLVFHSSVVGDAVSALYRNVTPNDAQPSYNRTRCRVKLLHCLQVWYEGLSRFLRPLRPGAATLMVRASCDITIQPVEVLTAAQLESLVNLPVAKLVISEYTLEMKNCLVATARASPCRPTAEKLVLVASQHAADECNASIVEHLDDSDGTNDTPIQESVGCGGCPSSSLEGPFSASSFEPTVLAAAADAFRALLEFQESLVGVHVEVSPSAAAAVARSYSIEVSKGKNTQSASVANQAGPAAETAEGSAAAAASSGTAQLPLLVARREGSGNHGVVVEQVSRGDLVHGLQHQPDEASGEMEADYEVQVEDEDDEGTGDPEIHPARDLLYEVVEEEDEITEAEVDERCAAAAAVAAPDEEIELSEVSLASYGTIVAAIEAHYQVAAALRKFALRDEVPAPFQQQRTHPPRLYLSVARLPPAALRAFIETSTKLAGIFLPVYVVEASLNHNFAQWLMQQELQVLGPESKQRSMRDRPLPTDIELTDLHGARLAEFLWLLVDLLYHPALELRRGVLGCWFVLMGNRALQTFYPRNPHGFELTLTPAFHGLLETLIQVSQCPPAMQQQIETFGFETWMKFRDDCSAASLDLGLLLGPDAVISVTHEGLEEWLRAYERDPEAAKLLWRKTEAAVLILSNITSRSSQRSALYLPWALQCILPILPYNHEVQRQQSSGLIDAHTGEITDSLASLESAAMLGANSMAAADLMQTVILQSTASRLILQASPLMRTHKALFAPCFKLLLSFIPSTVRFSSASGLAAVLSAERRIGVLTSLSELACFASHCERSNIEAINASVSLASDFLTKLDSSPESDLHFVLNSVSALVLMDQISLESRCSLVRTAGNLIRFLSKDKLQMYHYQLAKKLYNRALEEFPPPPADLGAAPPPKPSPFALRVLRLFFTAVESVEPATKFQSPPPSANAVLLEKASSCRYPVLTVMEELWPLFERCLIELHADEQHVEMVCHCVVQVFSLSPLHAIRYATFGRFLQSLSASFVLTPSVFHLGTLRSILGTFGAFSENPVIEQLCGCLLACVQAVLKRMQEMGIESFVAAAPDLLGMTLDCMNTALASATLSASFLEIPAFHDTLILCVTMIPRCHHPKVLTTMILLLMRFTTWLNPLKATQLSTMYLRCQDRNSEVVLEAAQRSVQSALQITRTLDIHRKAIASTFKVLTEVFQGNIQWIGLIASICVELLQIDALRNETLSAIRATLETCPKQIVTPSMIEDVENVMADPSACNHRDLCNTLQVLADHCESNWNRTQFEPPGAAVPA